MLAILIERPGEIVTRDELRRRLWDGDTFVDYESGLNTAANRLRLKLGDSADSPRYIETMPRSGYRFIARRADRLGAATPSTCPRRGDCFSLVAPARSRTLGFEDMTLASMSRTGELESFTVGQVSINW